MTLQTHTLIYEHSCEDMREIADNSVSLVVTSPPYNCKLEYDVYRDNQGVTEYVAMLDRVWKECFRILRTGGRICVNVGNTMRDPYFPLNMYVMQGLLKTGFLIRGEIIWIKPNGCNSSSQWGSWKSPSNPTIRDGHEYILVGCKESYHLDPMVPDAVSDMTGLEFTKWTQGEWRMQPIHTSETHGHPAAFPLELPLRCIKLFSYPGDTVVDPFCGIGTTLVAAKRLHRQGIGYELSPHYAEIARMRCQQQPLTLFCTQPKQQKLV